MQALFFRTLIERVDLNSKVILMDDHKFCFILCTNNDLKLNECINYLKLLHVPEGYSTDIITVTDAKSMCSGYEEAMKSSDAKYKIYMHQDVYIVNRFFLDNILYIFNTDEKIGMIGIVGVPRMPYTGVMWQTFRVGAIIPDFSKFNKSTVNSLFPSPDDKLYDVEAIDGLLMATSHDVDWREDLFDGFDFYDVSQSFEMRRHGYSVVVPVMTQPMVFHEDGVILDLSNYDKFRKKFLSEYNISDEIKRPVINEEEASIMLNNINDYSKYSIISNSLKEIVDKNLSYQNPEFFISTFGYDKLRNLIYCSSTGFLLYSVNRIVYTELKNKDEKSFINGLISYDELKCKFITLLQSLRRIQFFLPEEYKIDACRWMKENNISFSCILSILNNDYLFFNEDKRILNYYKDYLRL